MSSLPIIDLSIILLYLAGMIGVGFYFSRKNKSSDQFTTASGLIPGWIVGISIFATFLSSNTFLGVPGKAFGTNWNAFVFSISMPFAAWAASKYFVPFYRRTNEVSAYTHLEKRFGAWARTYAVVCFLLTQLARMGSIFFGIALSLQALTGFSMEMIMIVMGICIIIYTVMGGIEAVIWTEVVQAFILTFGALAVLFIAINDLPGGVSKIIEIGSAENKFSLGTFMPDFTQSSFWVILLYGFFINLNNFGMDQNYVQRYHTAKSSSQASKSIWLCVWLYLIISLLFFVIGTSLFAYYQENPEFTGTIKRLTAIERLGAGASEAELQAAIASLQPADYGDKVMPHFIVTKMPAGLVGIIISAILAAAMSTISSGMNASATVFSVDIFTRYIKSDVNDKQKLTILHVATVIFGFLGLISGIAMIGVKSILDVWWELSGIFAAGMLGLFLLGIISRQTRGHEALTATLIGIIVILWMTFSGAIPEQYEFLRSTLNTNMIIVVGTLTIFLTGIVLTRLRVKKVPLEVKSR